MHRVTISMSDAFAAELDVFMAKSGYTNRSEALRDLARAGLEQAAASTLSPGPCVAAFTYVYDHHQRDLSARLTRDYHDHHEISVATLHVHLDHDNCLEVSVLRGDGVAIQEFAQGVSSERGVRYGRLNLVPVDIVEQAHGHSHDHDGEPHLHVHPKG